ncbi:MAG: multiheme c-type cytochrome [Ginsengibacter sp.]
MMIFSRYKTSGIVASIIVITAAFATCMDNDKLIVRNNAGKAFAGSDKCQQCHKETYDHFVKTSHYRTSLPASPETIMGDFTQGKNLFSYSYYSKVAMEHRDSGLYQVEYDKNFKELHAYKFGMTIGSGTRGQSYLSWVDSSLIQLPVSYFTAEKSWANSPGFKDFEPSFTRTISAQCLECHSTYFKTLSPANSPAPVFDRTQIIYGVQCESCHGPAADHITYHEEHPNQAKGYAIYNPASLSRQQQLDLCGVCHGGTRPAEQIAFSFLPGDTLTTSPKAINKNIDEGEVHDNRYRLFAQSKCFKVSTTLTCNTCHNTHEQERGNVALFSSKCVTCHDGGHEPICKMTATLGKTISANCIDCHMPEKQSRMLTIKLEGEVDNEALTFRSHIIAIYPKETEKFMLMAKPK